MASEPRLKFTWGGLVVIVLLALVLWWVDEGGGDEQPGAGATQEASASTAASPTPTTTPPDRPSASPTPSARPTTPSSRPTPSAGSVPGVDPESGLDVVVPGDLPAEAREVLADIDDGGPYEFDQDDTVFKNYEGILPAAQVGYYREYTVPTPGLGHRGALRIVVGGEEFFYWTDDHYASFARIWR